MGKKDAQRTKGNTKASSSARSAQFLGENIGFVGFGTSTETAFVPILVDSNDPSDDVPADMRVVLRKMHKKDLTTKIKALQEFLELAEKMTEAEMLAVLPFWPSVYTKLATDVDGRVREQAHTCLEAVVTRVGRNLATHLKTLCSVWFLGRFDPHPPAASAAASAWTAAFPAHKQAGAISFCQAEIVSLVMDNLTVATPQTLSDPNTTSPEEMESKFSRTLYMSFSALSSIIQLSPASSKSLKSLLEHPKFWKYSKNKYGPVRQGFFEFIFQLCTVQPGLAQEHVKHLAPAVLANLSEPEVGPATAVWTAALQVLASVPGAWDQVNLTKAVLPPVYKLMASAGGGCLAQHLFTNLMPLLSSIPVLQLTADDNRVMDRWLSSLDTGLTSLLESDKPKQEDDINAVVVAYVECIMLLINNEAVDQDVKVKILEEHLLSNLVMKSLSDPKLAKSDLNETLAKFISSWDTKHSLSKLNTLFWASLTHHCVTCVNNGDDLDSCIQMLSVLSRSDPRQDSLSSVKMVICKVWDELCTVLDSDDNLDDSEKVNKCVDNLFKILTKCDLKSDEKMLKRVFPQSDSKQKFIVKIEPLLKKNQMISASSSLLFAIVSLMETKEAVQILVNACIDNNSNSILCEEIISTFLKLFSETKSDDGLFKSWINDVRMKQLIVEYIRKYESELRNDGKLENKKVVSSILSAGVNFTESEVDSLLKLFKEGLANSPASSRYSKFVGQVCRLLPNKDDKLWTCGLGASVAFSLFISEDANNFEDVWLTSCLKSDMDTELWQKIKTFINGSLESNLTMSHLESLIVKCEKLFENRTIGEVFDFINIDSQDDDKVTLSLLEDVIGQQVWLSNLSVASKVSDDGGSDLESPQKSLILCKLVLKKFFPNSGIINPSDTVTDCDRTDVPEEVVKYLVKFIVSFCYLSKLIENCEADVIPELKEELETSLISVVARLGKESYQKLRHELRKSSLTEGKLYTDGLVWFMRIVYNTSEWSPQIGSLLPNCEIRTDAEVTTICKLMQLASELGIEADVVTLETDLVTATLISLGDSWSILSDSLIWLLSHCIQLSSSVQLEAVTDQLASILVLIQAATADNKDQLLYNRDLSEVTWQEAARVASLARFLSVVISKCPDILTPEMWDFICCSLVSWSSSIEESQQSLTSHPCSLVTSSVCSLASVMGSLLCDSNQDQSKLPAKLKQEWEEFFAEGVYSVLVPVYVSVTSSKSESRPSRSMIKQLCSAVSWCPSSLLLSSQLPALHLVQDVDSSSHLPDNIVFLYNHLGPLLTSPCRHTQTSAAMLLMIVARNTKEEDDDDEETKEIPRRLVEVIKQGDALLETLLQEFKIGEVAGSIPPGNAAHTITLGYLLSWKVILALLETAGDELGPKYTEYIKANGYLDAFLGHLFRLLPKTASQNKEIFLTKLDVLAAPSAQEIHQLAGSCWVSVCRHLPAVARTWWSNLDKVGKEAVERVTSSVVTPLLWREETEAIEAAEKSDNMSVRVRDSVREVVATYTIDEGSMELVISLPSNHPLGGLTVETGNRVGVDMSQWRKWMLQLTTFLTYQNGTILGGLNIWKKNVDKRFEGVEECYICFYILHGSNHQLPKLACRTCKKKFHAACLYKWFSTSNQSSCPLCRNLF